MTAITAHVMTCPNASCGNAPTVYTHKVDNAKWHAISCARCGISTGYTRKGFNHALKRWNVGISLHDSHGKPYTMSARVGRVVSMVVDV